MSTEKIEESPAPKKTAPKQEPSGWIGLLKENWKLAVIAALWLDNRSYRQDIAALNDKFNQYVQSAANAQAASNARWFERETAKDHSYFSNSVGYDTSHDSAQKTTP